MLRIYLVSISQEYLKKSMVFVIVGEGYL